MNLQLSHRWEHALLAATVDTASKKRPECYLGRTAIQKLLYFMKVLDVPMRYSFDIHHFGPFCSAVMNDVDWLLADEVILDRASGRRYSNYRPGITWPELQAKFAAELNEHKATIESVCEALGDMTPENLELIATLDFSFRWVHARGGTGPWKGMTVEKFKSIKQERFRDEDINFWYDILVKAGLIEA